MNIKNENCPCLRIECRRHGNCEECRKNHHQQGYLPTCERPKDINGDYILPVLGSYLVSQLTVVVHDVEETKNKFASFFGVLPPDCCVAVCDGFMFDGCTTEAIQGVTCKIVYFSLGPQLQLRLLEPDGQSSVWREYLDKHGEGLFSIAFGVNNIDQKIELCDRIGIPCLQVNTNNSDVFKHACLDARNVLKCFIELIENRKY